MQKRLPAGVKQMGEEERSNKVTPSFSSRELIYLLRAGWETYNSSAALLILLHLEIVST